MTTTSTRIGIATLWLFAMGCGAAAGEDCHLDSDCAPGTICGLDGTCSTPEAVAARLGPQEGDRVVAGTDRYRVTSIVLATEDNGLANLSVLANAFIEGGIEDGSIVVELRAPSPLPEFCESECSWSTPDADYGSDFPIPIPGGTALVEDVRLETGTGHMTGLANKQAVLDQLPESLVETAAALIDNDTDIDGDGVFDRASAIVQVEFELISE